MKPAVKFDAESQTVEVMDGGEPVTLRMEAINAIFETLMKASAAPALEEPEGVHYPTGINAAPSDEALRLVMDFPDGSMAQFVFPAPGKTHDQVAVASEAIRQGFLMLFASH